jgi:hypothetical protein
MFVLPNRRNEKKHSALKGRFGGIVYIRRPLEEGFGWIVDIMVKREIVGIRLFKGASRFA